LACTIIGGAIAYWFPGLAGSMSILLWLLPLAVFFGTFVFAWTFAPYQLAQESASKISGLQGDVDHERAKSRDQSRHYEERVEANAEAYKARIHELSSENERLRNDLAGRNEAAARVEHIRTILLEQADRALNEAGYDENSARAWTSATELILRESLVPQISGRFRTWCHSYTAHAESVASVKAIACNLKVEDLLRK
jgi:hypothetical protein